MHVVLTIHTAELYGAARSMVNHVVALRERGYEFTALLPAHGPLEQALREQGVTVEVSPLEHFGLKRNPWRWSLPHLAWRAAASRWHLFSFVIRRLRELGRPIVHVHSTLVLHAAVAAKVAGCQILWHVREERSREPYPGRGLFYRWRRQLFVEWRRLVVRLLANHIVYVSEEVRRKYALPRIPSSVAFNFLTLPPERPWPHSSDGKLRILYAGRITFEKGADDFLCICRALQDRGIAFEAVMAGDAAPGYRAFHEKRMRELDLEAQVRLVGYQKDMTELYTTSDVLLFPSQTEAFPRAVMEAMASGLPVVASSVGGIPEMIKHGRSGFLSAVAAPQDAVAALERLAREPGLRSEIGKAARERAAVLFSRETYADTLDRVYRDMTGA